MTARYDIHRYRRMMHPERRPHRPSADGDGPVCDGIDCRTAPCVVRELWPLDGESQADMLARLKAKYGQSAW